MNSEERSPSTHKRILTHNEFVSAVCDLSFKIKNWEKENYKFDALVPIKRGGLVVATYLSHLLDDRPIDTDPVTREHCLFVDDIVDTGETMDRVEHGNLSWIFKLQWEKEKFATIAKKPWSSKQPHFYVFETTDWLVFPWETQS